jgi:hypothetical protein
VDKLLERAQSHTGTCRAGWRVWRIQTALYLFGALSALYLSGVAAGGRSVGVLGWLFGQCYAAVCLLLLDAGSFLVGESCGERNAQPLQTVAVWLPTVRLCSMGVLW